jgi:molecular chaperone Hsp33
MPRPARFNCDCSSERVANALRMLGRAEIESILEEQGMVGVTCEFCNRRYSFVAADALALFSHGDP